MTSRPESEALVMRLLPSANPDPSDRASAWAEWQASVGEESLSKFIRAKNDTQEPDEDILQDALLTAYQVVERGHYERRDGIPFTAYVKGIAWNKIREARRREWSRAAREHRDAIPEEIAGPELEHTIQRREECRALVQGLSELPRRNRQVLECYLRGDSTAEIAAKMQMSEELVRQHKCRALRRLKQTLRYERV